MVKRFSVIALAGMLVLPMAAAANGDSSVNELERKIEELTRQLAELKATVEQQKEVNEEQEEILGEIDEKSESWDLAARFKFYGDFRSRLDYYNADTLFGRDLDNDTLWTNRFRLNMRVKATENVEFKGRLAMYKTWGMQSAFTDDSGTMWPVFDGNVTRTPAEDSAIYVDRAFVNWNNIAGVPMWFSIGRRPTTDGPPAEIRLGLDERLGTPMAFMNWPFDGLVLGYGWSWGAEQMGTSKLRFCYGRGFESGLQAESVDSVDDMDFAGFAWDLMKKGDRFAYIQSFMAFDVVNYPNFQSEFIEYGAQQEPIMDPNDPNYPGGFGPRMNLGNIWHTSVLFQDKVRNLNYFVAGGYSQTIPDAQGLFFYDGTPNTDNENGYSVYTGVRYDWDEIGLKLGGEFNWGSQYWLAMSPGHDDIYQSKLAARGQVYEVYLIYDLPTGEALSKYAKTFIRLGYQHYDFNYAGSGDWNMYPYDFDDAADRAMLQAMNQDPVDSADQIYLTFETYF